jgi:hypothetical protein
MRDDQLEKEFLRDRILPLLFSSKSATTFVAARNTFDEHETSIDSLQESYDSRERENEEFWTEVAEIVSDAYDSEVPDFSEEDFREFVKKLIVIRFDKEFRKNDVKKFEDGTDVESFLDEIAGGNDLLLEDEESNPRVIYVGERTSREYVEPLQPTDAEFYPPMLIEVDSENSEIHLSGDRDQRNRFVRETTDRDSIDLQDEEPEAYEELEIEPGFIQKLKDHDIFLKNIRIMGGSSDISLSVASGDGAIDVQDFVDYDLLLQDKQDIMSLSKCEFLYVLGEDEEDIEFKLNFQTFKRVDTNLEFIKIALELSAEDESAREEIEEIIKNYGVEVYKPYYKPSSYYFNKIIKTNSNYRDKYLSPLEEMGGDDELKILLDEDIIDTEIDGENISLNKEVLVEAIQSKLDEAERVDVELDGRQHRIAHVEDYENNRLAIILKSYSDDPEDDHRRFYRVVIPFRARPKKFEKIYNIVLSRARTNYHEILTSESEREVVEYLVRAAQRHIKYHQHMLIEKEARRSVKILKDYFPDPEGFRERYDSAAKAGDVIEDHLNVVLRYLFRDYLYGGGKNEPDGALQLQGQYYLLDSKQISSIPQNQLNKASKDLDNSKYSDLVESDSMIFLISKELLLSDTESGSLNPDARDRVSREEDTTFHFVCVEAICELYEIFSENSNILSSNNNVRDDVFSNIKDMVEESRFADDCEELTENEERYLGEIRQRIDSADYMPEDRERYF